MAAYQPIPYRIRIGVTGHRDLKDPETVRALVIQVITARIWELFPSAQRRGVDRIRDARRTPISFRVVSPLAEGADRAVAHAVLDDIQDENVRLDAVLPLALEDYLEDFATEGSRVEFTELLNRCRKQVVLRRRRISEERSDPNGQEELRRAAYARVGRYVVDHCDVLIAVWDGLPSRGRGGTAEIVEYAQQQRRPVFRIWGGLLELWNAKANDGLDASWAHRHRPIQPGNPLSPVIVENLDKDHFTGPMIPR